MSEKSNVSDDKDSDEMGWGGGYSGICILLWSKFFVWYKFRMIGDVLTMGIGLLQLVTVSEILRSREG